MSACCGDVTFVLVLTIIVDFLGLGGRDTVVMSQGTDGESNLNEICDDDVRGGGGGGGAD